MRMPTDTHIRTERLCLRPPKPTDRDALLAIHADADVARYLLHDSWDDPAQADAWIEASIDGWQSHSEWRFVLIDARRGRCVGTCMLFRMEKASARAELGYVLGREHWGAGFMIEAVRAVIGWAFDHVGLRRLEAEIAPANRTSARLLERAGFVHEGRLRERWCVAGHISDSDIYGLLSSQIR